MLEGDSGVLLRSYSHRYNGLVRHRGADDPATIEAKRVLDVARLEILARKLVADWPDLTDEQRGRLTLILCGR